MPDNKTKRGAPDRRKVAALQEHEVRRIAKKFHVPMSDVRKSIHRVGNDRVKVEADLGARIGRPVPHHGSGP